MFRMLDRSAIPLFSFGSCREKLFGTKVEMRTHRCFDQSSLNRFDLTVSRPALTHKTFGRRIDFEQVHCRVDRFHFQNLNLPYSNRFGNQLKQFRSMVFGLSNDQTEIFDASHHAADQLSPLVVRRRIRINTCAETEVHTRTFSLDSCKQNNEPVTNLLNSILQLFALIENDERRFLNLFTLNERNLMVDEKQTSVSRTVVGSLIVSGKSSCLRKTLPRQILHNIRSKEILLSRRMTPVM